MFGEKRPGKRSWGAVDKIIVPGILKRNGQFRTFPVQGRSAAELIALVREQIHSESLYYTDDWHA
jgi:transposase